MCGRLLARIAGSNLPGSVSVCCECCVLSGRGLCVGLITRPEPMSNQSRKNKKIYKMTSGKAMKKNVGRGIEILLNGWLLLGETL